MSTSGFIWKESNMFTKVFWVKATERAVKTAGQFGLAAWGTVAWTQVGEVVPAGQAVGLAVLFGAGLSCLTSLATANIGPEDTPSAV